MANEILYWSINWGYIYHNFIVNLFLIWLLNFFDFCLSNFTFDASYQKVMWEDGEPYLEYSLYKGKGGGGGGGRGFFLTFSKERGLNIFP